MLNTNDECVLVSLRDGVRVIKLNRPKLKNAYNEEVFRTITNTLNNDALNDDIVTTILTSTGNFYSSGLELQKQKVPNVDVIKDFVSALINYPKLLIAVVNGPAYGIAASALPLFDIVYASNRASFCTPFIHHGFTQEACSSYLFPRVMGKSKAMQMLLLGEKITAEDALNSNLISEIVPHEKLDELFEKLIKLGKLPVSALKTAKKLVNFTLKEKLNKLNDEEMAIIKENFNSGHYLQVVQKFTLKKNKL